MSRDARRLNRAALALLACTLIGPATASADLFDVTATPTGTSPAPVVNAAGSSLLSIVENVANNQGQFAALQNQPFNSTITYAGIKGAILVDQATADDGEGNVTRSINLRVPSVGVNQTFSSANGSLLTQVRDFLKKEGLADLSAFQAYVDRNTAVGVVDGNPLALDMLLADAGYQEFAMHVSPFETNGSRFSSDGGKTVSRYWIEGGILNAGGYAGQYAQLTFATEFHLNDNVGISITTPLRYQKIESANIFSGGALLGVPITILPARGGHFFWQVTPAAHSGIVGSADLVSGGLIYGGQADNSLGFSFGPLTLSMANEAGYFHGADVNIAGYHFNTALDQVQFKNGLQLQLNFGGLCVDASGTWTNFLHDTFTDGYLTPELGVGIKFGAHAGLRVGYIGNFGRSYTTNGGNILFYLSN